MLGVSHGELEMGRGLPELSGAIGKNIERLSSPELVPDMWRVGLWAGRVQAIWGTQTLGNFTLLAYKVGTDWD